MSKALNQNTVNEIEYSAILSQYVYADEQNTDYVNKDVTINDIVNYKSNEIAYAENLANDDTLKNALNSNDEIKNFRVISQSKIDGGFDMKELIACTFYDPATGNVYVTYRGTGDGKWVDNGDAMANPSSYMQDKALEYYDKVVEDILPNYNVNKIIVTGHSKGGNLAQFVTMSSGYGGMIDNCYSFDGQGFSESAVEKFKENWGDDYEKQIAKMYSINGENDYVHDLGNPIISKENTYFVKTKGKGITEFHILTNMFNEDGRLNWVDENGNINFDIEQGPVGKLAKDISERMMALDEAAIDDCAIVIMSLLERVMGDDYQVGTGDRETAELMDYIGFVIHGIPLLLSVIAESEEICEALDLLGLGEYKPLIEEIQNYVKINNIEDFGAYIWEDPIRLIEVYSSLDLTKKAVNELLAKVITKENISGLLTWVLSKYPLESAMTIGILTNPLVMNFISITGTVIVSLTTIGLMANHIIKNWDDICESIGESIENIQDKISEYFNNAIMTVETQINEWVESIIQKTEELVSNVSNAYNSAVDFVANLINEIKAYAVNEINRMLNTARALLYNVYSRVYGISNEYLSINVDKLRSCVETLNRLAIRIKDVDTAMDNLYFRLARHNIQQGNGAVVSVTNMYNLFRADFNVDEGWNVQRKANALADFFSEYERVEATIATKVPKPI